MPPRLLLDYQLYISLVIKINLFWLVILGLELLACRFVFVTPKQMWQVFYCVVTFTNTARLWGSWFIQKHIHVCYFQPLMFHFLLIFLFLCSISVKVAGFLKTFSCLVFCWLSPPSSSLLPFQLICCTVISSPLSYHTCFLTFPSLSHKGSL